MAGALPPLDLLPDEDVSFETLYLHMAKHIAEQMEARDAAGERLYTDACHWMDDCFATQAQKDKLAHRSVLGHCLHEAVAWHLSERLCSSALIAALATRCRPNLGG